MVPVEAKPEETPVLEPDDEQPTEEERVPVESEEPSEGEAATSPAEQTEQPSPPEEAEIETTAEQPTEEEAEVIVEAQEPPPSEGEKTPERQEEEVEPQEAVVPAEAEELLEPEEEEVLVEEELESEEEPAKPRVPETWNERLRIAIIRKLPQIIGISLSLITFVILIFVAERTYRRLHGTTEEVVTTSVSVQEQQQLPPIEEGKGWESEEEIAKKLEKIIGKPIAKPQPKTPPAELDPKHVLVAKDGSGNFSTIEEALVAVEPGGTVEILDAGPYQEAGIGARGSDSAVVPEKNDITIEATSGKFAVMTPPEKGGDGRARCIITVGKGWRFKNISFRGRERKVCGIECTDGKLELNGCQFIRLKYAIVHDSPSPELNIANSVFASNGWGILFTNPNDAVRLSLRNSLIYDCNGFVLLRQKPDEKEKPKELSVVMRDNIFLDVEQIIFGRNIPPKFNIDSDYNALCRANHKPWASNAIGKKLRVLRQEKKTEVHSITANPRVRVDFKLDENSPCIGKASDGGNMGVRWEELWVDIQRKGYDIPDR